MKELEINLLLLDKIKKVIFQYENKIPNSLHYYYKDILDGKNVETYMKSYSLSYDDILKYARICRLIKVYSDILELIDVVKNDGDVLDKADIEEYQNIVNEMQDECEELLKNITTEEIIEDEVIEFGNSTNVIIYSPYINESVSRTINAHSGREEQTQKSVANLIEQLRNADYQNLRKKGYIHQVVAENNKPNYVDGCAFERIGRGTTKLNYIRIPVSEKNKSDIRRFANADFDTLYLVVSFGDFKNEGYSENRYYDDVNSDFNKHINDITFIINIFKNDFNQQTFPIAMNLINYGYKMTDELTSIKKDDKEQSFN